ncbi:MAG TPA: M23 family metallopeptidase [Pyrinomonadaceae bacterium]|nr:M23 family metallopeptidase [Pyrinomonadaceae bacterium]
MNRLQVLFCASLLCFVALVWLGTGRVRSPAAVKSVPVPVEPVSAPVVEPTPAVVEPTPSVGESVSSVAQQVTHIKPLIIPVAGIRPDQLTDTYSDSRSEGRTHDAIDIMAPADTPVLAAAGGQIIKLFTSERGGTTIYQLSADKKLIFYYAHLARYADGLTEGKEVGQGEVIAYVGDTGNAGAGNYHLHFSIAIVSDPKRYWEGTNINPYPLLRE